MAAQRYAAIPTDPILKILSLILGRTARCCPSLSFRRTSRRIRCAVGARTPDTPEVGVLKSNIMAIVMQKMIQSTLQHFRTRYLLYLAGVTLSFCVLAGAWGQASSESPVTPEVQALYAEARVAQAQGDSATAIQKYRAMLKLAPRLAAAYNNLGILYFNQRDYSKAVEVLGQGLKVNPNMPSASAMLGTCFFEMGQYSKAIAPLEAALRSNAKDDHAEMMLARTLVNLKDYAPATTHLKNIVDRNPKDQQAWYLLGKSYLQLSEAALSKINEIDPNSVLSHEIAGEVDESLHNYDEALVEYKKAVDIAPRQPGTHYHMANAYWVMGKWSSAAEEFRAELANDPHNCTARWKMANSLFAADAPADEVLPELNQALEYCPDLMQAHVDRARAYIKLSRPADAIEDLLIAVKDEPDEPSIHFLLATAYKAQGKTAEYQTELHKFGELQRGVSAAAAARASDAMNIKEKSK